MKKIITRDTLNSRKILLRLRKKALQFGSELGNYDIRTMPAGLNMLGKAATYHPRQLKLRLYMPR